jgi:nitroreductase
MILQAGLYAPNAGERQSCMIVVCQNMEILNQLGKINKSVFTGRVSLMSVSKDQPSIADDETLASGFYSAPTVLMLFGPKNFIYSMPDCCVMAENMMLAAFSLSIGSCMVMRAEDTFASELGKRMQNGWDIDMSYEAKCFVTLGYPDTTIISKSKPRKENRIKRVS